MNRPTKLLLAVSLFAAVLSIGASTSSPSGHRTLPTGASGSGPVAHDVASCQIATNAVYDTKWDEDYSPPSYFASNTSQLDISGLNTPFTDIANGATTDSGSWTYLSATTDYSTGDYYGLVDLGTLNQYQLEQYQLELYNPDGTPKQLVESTGSIIAVGDGYLFYLGIYPPDGNGEILSTLPDVTQNLT